VAAEYDRAAKDIEEPDLKELLTRLRDQELYHVDILGDLLKEEKMWGRER
jgi:rubrerythrin